MKRLRLIVFLTASAMAQETPDRAKVRAEAAEQIRMLEAAKDARRKEAEGKLAREKKMADSVIEATVRVTQIIDGGIMAAPIGSAHKGPPQKKIIEVTIYEAMGEKPPPNRGWKVPMVKQEIDARDPISLNDVIFIACKTTSFFAGATTNLKFWPAGIYRYISERNIEHSVPSYSTVYVEEKK